MILFIGLTLLNCKTPIFLFIWFYLLLQLCSIEKTLHFYLYDFIHYFNFARLKNFIPIIYYYNIFIYLFVSLDLIFFLLISHHYHIFFNYFVYLNNLYKYIKETKKKNFFFFKKTFKLKPHLLAQKFSSSSFFSTLASLRKIFFFISCLLNFPISLVYLS